MYASPVNKLAMHNLMYLTGQTNDGDPQCPQYTFGIPGQTKLISCTGGTGVWLSVDPDVPYAPGSAGIEYVTTDLGHQLDNTWQ